MINALSFNWSRIALVISRHILFAPTVQLSAKRMVNSYLFDTISIIFCIVLATIIREVQAVKAETNILAPSIINGKHLVIGGMPVRITYIERERTNIVYI